MTDRTNLKARLEAIEDELWDIKMCDAHNRWVENHNREWALIREKREILNALNAQGKE